ncbi:MAG TPA: hypothetical protein VMO26_16435 [Vicinamibacterales bacterium]|nr:hypothetical protein [Vicinamibacterales bacterium]
MMASEALVPPAVYTIWWIGLVLTLVVFVPLAVVLLHRLWRAARSIQIYAREALTAAGGIAGHTGQIGALDRTIQVATEMLSTAGDIEQKLNAATGVLARRADQGGGRGH